MRHKVFISYHHDNDQSFKDELVRIGEGNNDFIDRSVKEGDISDTLSDESIRETIRDKYLRDSTVTILLVGKETKNRKFIDWELYSSMYNGDVNKKSGIIVILLPSAESAYCTAAFPNERSTIYPYNQWESIQCKEEFRRRYEYMPERIIDNLIKNDVKISVINWNKLTSDILKMMIENAYDARETNNYDLSRPMKKRNN